MLLVLKIALSIPIGIGLLYPFFRPHPSGGVLSELRIFGTAGTVAVVLAFLFLVALYARDLARTLHRVAPASRSAQPASVWWMFLLPYNFIEDFFIVANVAKSLKSEAASNPALSGFRSFGLCSGMVWCAAQIVSLVPHQIGSAAGMVAILAWAWHWSFIRRALRALATGSGAHEPSLSRPDAPV